VIIQTWNWILNFGVSDDHQADHELIQFYNLMSLISGFGILFVFLFAWWINFSPIYLCILSVIFFMYVSIIAANFFGKIQLARYIVAIGSAVWVSVSYALVGGYFNQGMAILSAMAITYVTFQKKPKTVYRLVIFQISLLFLSSIYVSRYQPILGLIDFPYDDIMVFLGGFGWIAILLYKFNKDRRNLLLDLKNNNIELEKTTTELERFTYIASHDLKSPLRTINSFICLIERDIKKENYANIQEKLDFVKTGAEQMHFLVEDILELSMLKEQEKVKRVPIDLNLVLEKAKHNLKNEIEEKNAIIFAENLPPFLGNEIELLVLFQNFIQNGIKYNDSEQASIHITAQKTEQSIIFSFRDNGIGIDKKYHTQIFQFFKRLHNSTKYQGTGLGLGLCKKIIDNYQGTIHIDSQIGIGTTFTITFPLKSAAPVDQKVTAAVAE